MSSFWDYRVMRKIEDNGEHSLAVHEVFFGDNGRVESWTQEPVALKAETDANEDTKAALDIEPKHYASALSKLILDFANGHEIEN